MDDTPASDTQGGAGIRRAGRGVPIVVRLAGVDDFSTIRHVHASAVRSSVGTLLDQEQADAAVEAIYTPEYILELSAYTIFVAEVHGSIAGTCGWMRTDHQDRLIARVGALFVAPAFQGAGIARRLLAAIHADVAQQGLDTIGVEAPLTVVPLFESLGYSLQYLRVSTDVVFAIEVDVSWLERSLQD